MIQTEPTMLSTEAMLRLSLSIMEHFRCNFSFLFEVEYLSAKWTSEGAASPFNLRGLVEKRRTRRRPAFAAAFSGGKNHLKRVRDMSLTSLRIIVSGGMPLSRGSGLLGRDNEFSSIVVMSNVPKPSDFDPPQTRPPRALSSARQWLVVQEGFGTRA